MNTLYLASGSPRRREILENLGYTVIRIPAEIDETPSANEPAADYVQRMAREKNAAAVAQWFCGHDAPPDCPILTADTTVAHQNHILGKPEHAGHAAEILSLLSGTTHQVFTAVCVYWQGETRAVLQQSDVRFKTLSAAEIQAYTDSGEPMDKAGAYGIQGLGGVFVEHLQGSFTGVMGLPVFETAELLRGFGLAVPPFAKAV
ncbi:Maf family protein [Neisseria animalis]|uniref:dTTP/UTP pyrophosphatase n=1 Tax=Neisseria animalis TaxID=492 RepID=A0A5P3MPF2_NEIAN|nr:Maf family protein [Neisseria animalis]QEY23290.1 septum formation inhibitor Maf [Neisseria animalis]ROW31956.1 septum formation inhibitor Maf [Neisseria animalis]VEE08597.1 septum formation protein Maf [Neisseria animalis]